MHDMALQQAFFSLGIIGEVSETAAWGMCAALLWAAFDWLLGTCGAAKTGTLSSTKAREGLWHKAGEVALVLLAFAIDVVGKHMDLGFTSGILVLACTYVILMETMSILENICVLCPELKGTKLMQLFANAKADGIAGDEKKEG